MRLLYLDEAGTDFKAPSMCVAGVMVHGDYEWPEVDRLVVGLIDKYIPEPDRIGFVFHATDIYHGSGYFDRRKPEWADFAKSRLPILEELAGVITALSLPIVLGTYAKDRFGIGVLEPDDTPGFKEKLMHNVAMLDCLLWANRWLDKFAPDELATVVHEDGTAAKLGSRLIKPTIL